MKKILFSIVLLSLLMASACAPTAPVENTEPEATLHELSITATSEGWSAPESAPAGWTEITLINQSEEMRQTAFMHLDDDKTMDDVFAAIEAGMEGAPAWMTPYGGVSGLMPGETRSVTINLPAGQYVVIDPVADAEGVPGMAKGYFMSLTVEESDVPTAAPSGDMSLELVDYAFAFDTDTVTAGNHVIRVSNSGPQEAHEAVFIKLNDGATVQDFLAAFAPDAPAGPPPGQIVAGTAPFDTSTENYLEVEFEPGATYALICFLPSSEHEGKTHFMLGMISQFDVSN